MIAKRSSEGSASLCVREGQDWEGSSLAQNLFWGFPSALPVGGYPQEAVGHCAWSAPT